MTWLLVQIGLCLVLAALAGWFIGWSMRGFRETDRVEDLRQTLSATTDVKDRELSESYREVESLRSRNDSLERANRALETKVGEARKPSAPDSTPRAMLATPARHPVPEAMPERSRGGAAVEVLEDARQRLDARADLATERRLRAKVEAELRQKAATFVALQAEADSLRTAVDERAAHIAKLESRVIELEPLEDQLDAGRARVRELETRLEAAAATDASPAHKARMTALQEQLTARDVLVNELRTRANDLRAELDSVRRERHGSSDNLAASDAKATRLQREVEETGRKLQRQIERNRKQETVHRSVVETLQRDLDTLRRDADDARSAREELESRHVADASDDEHLREALARRDSQIVAYRRRLADLEEDRHLELRQPGRDDLKLIRGVGPVFEGLLNKIGVTRFEEVARWNADDIERIADALGTNVKRIVSAGWVESARKLR